MFNEDQVAGQHRRIETIKRAVQGQSERGLYLRGLRACRTAAMLNQRELAARAHTYQSTINALERQNRAASLAMVRRLCEALDVGPADLCSAEPEHPSDKDFTAAVKKTGGANEDIKTISNREEQVASSGTTGPGGGTGRSRKRDRLGSVCTAPGAPSHRNLVKNGSPCRSQTPVFSGPPSTRRVESYRPTRRPLPRDRDFGNSPAGWLAAKGAAGL